MLNRTATTAGYYSMLLQYEILEKLVTYITRPQGLLFVMPSSLSCGYPRHKNSLHTGYENVMSLE